MEDKYQKLNDYLNDYCKNYNYSLYIDQIPYYLHLASEINREFYETFKNTKIDFTRFEEKPSLTLEESMVLCDEFIKTNLDEYYDKWKEWLVNGVVSFTDKQQTIIDYEKARGSWARTFKEDNQDFRSIEVELEHDYADPSIIIHEFLHQLNIGVLEEEGKVLETISRSLFTEGVSIYFETLMYRFMEDKGFSKEEIAKSQYERIKNLESATYAAIDGMILLRDYQYFGKITEDSFDEAKKYKLFSFSDKNIYQSVVDSVYSKIEGLSSDDMSKGNYPFNPFIPFRYVIGTSLAYWAMSQEDSNMTWKMLQFNQDLLKDRDLDYAFSRFSLNLNDIPSLVAGTKKEITRCVDNLNYEIENKR